MKAIIYQMLPRLWGNIIANPKRGASAETNGTGKFSHIDTESLEYIKGLGVSHIWFTGIIRHATPGDTGSKADRDWIKGSAGSPFAISDYFDVNPYLALEPDRRMEEFESLVRRTHEAGLRVIIDFVPNHVARNYGRDTHDTIVNGKDEDGHAVLGAEDRTDVHWSEQNDFFYYPGQKLELPVENQSYNEYPAKASGNCFSPAPGPNDWYDTIKINYCDTHTATWDKMLEVARFWAAKGVDGFRCDMVELVPAAFMKWLIAKIREEYPEFVFLAEVYQREQYGKYVRDVGFDWLYDKSGLYDALHDIVGKNVNDDGTETGMWQTCRRITWNWQFLGDLQPYMLNFLENHDELRFSSDFYGKDAENSYAALHSSLYFNTAPFMLYFGEEIGERGMDEEGLGGLNGRTSITDWWSVASLSRLYRHIHGEDSLTDKEKGTLSRYRDILGFASRDSAISMGTTYDLCYCNAASKGFDPDRHFAFLRNHRDEILLVVCNFSRNDAEMMLSIPQHAFEWLEIPENENMNHKKALHVVVKAMDAVVLKLC